MSNSTNTITHYSRCDKCLHICANERLIKYQSTDIRAKYCSHCYTDMQLAYMNFKKATVRVPKSLQPKGSWFQRLCKKNRVYLQDSTWERDLTRENIESNPGPVQSRFDDEYVRLFNHIHAAFDKVGSSISVGHIENIVLFIEGLCS